VNESQADSRITSREPLKPPKLEITDDQVSLRPSPSTSSGSRLSSSPFSATAARAAPAPLKHPLPARPVTESHNSRPAPRGTKRASSPTALERPRKRTFKWPTIDRMNTAKIKGEGDFGVRSIAFNSDGSQFAVCCAFCAWLRYICWFMCILIVSFQGYDRTVRVWHNPSRTELAKLPHTSPVVSVAWMEGDTGLVSLEDDGVVSKWTKTVSCSVGTNQSVVNPKYPQS
jgi:WD40 repeat protein